MIKRDTISRIRGNKRRMRVLTSVKHNGGRALWPVSKGRGSCSYRYKVKGSKGRGHRWTNIPCTYPFISAWSNGHISCEALSLAPLPPLSRPQSRFHSTESGGHRSIYLRTRSEQVHCVLRALSSSLFTRCQVILLVQSTISGRETWELI